ncbi:sodium/proton antiporter, NhaA family [Sanguibacter gelidistatuariae]|uniref:Na(+)/H(+) antiporter NhaA n=1 Tax=Sanguibacter gelidistatuariae TaxID=1814289 RepID=A0A1G6V0J2_9MICO|nr:Na+/H+ antiporter NhaA [Sanguibacter gelidistatuariae]SDD47003.1 sodium/proton antiporter, NhaA family [Sanguibacter gelidistatuariae]
MSTPPKPLLGRLTPGGLRNFTDTLRAENTGAILLLAGAVVALIWANSPFSESYRALGNLTFGPSRLHLDLSVAQWATDGLLAIFFFVVGLELKREMVDGELRRPSTAIVPILAAVGGMAVPAAVYSVINTLSAGGDPNGWAVPVATDIAFAVAVLTIFGRGLPTALRAFLLTLAVVDDLLGIVVIAVFYANGLNFVWMVAAFLSIGVFAVVVRRRGGASPWLLLPLAVLAWAFMHASGVHATIAGVALGFTVPALARTGERVSLAERYEHAWRPLSAGFAVPVFALFAAGVTMSASALSEAASNPAAQGVFFGLVLGKPIGILLATWLLVTFTGAALDVSLRWLDLLAVACVGGVGFTVALLIGELSFEPGTANNEAVKAAVLVGSLASAAIGGGLLAWRSSVRSRGALGSAEQTGELVG